MVRHSWRGRPSDDGSGETEDVRDGDGAAWGVHGGAARAVAHAAAAGRARAAVVDDAVGDMACR